MDDDEGHESFEINDTDFEYAMNPGRRHFQSKEQATYGVWAQEDSDDEDSKAPYRKKGKYTAPVGFVSGGIQQGSKIDKDDPESLAAGEYSSKREPEEEVIQIDFNRRTKKAQKEAGAQVFAGMRTSTTSGATDPAKFGDWLKHGKGSVVMKMMQSMGYKAGEGLGSSGQGIIEPVQAAVRKGRGAVGAYGKEMTGPKFGESAADAQKRNAQSSSNIDNDEVGETSQTTTKGGWKKSQKVKTRYRTIEDVLEENDSGSGYRASSTHAQTKVIDMTGPQQKVYSGYDSFSMKTKSEYEIDTEKREVFDVPELLHNLNLLVDLTEEGIRRNNHQLITLKDQSTALEYDMKQIEKALKDEEEEASRMKKVYDLIDGFTAKSSPTMNECQELFLKLRDEFPQEYRMYQLESVAIPCVLPLISQYFSKWKPLDPDHVIYGVELMKEWKTIIGNDKSTFGMNRNNSDEIPAFDRLIWDGWLPALRRATLTWNPRDEMNQMIELIETWMTILPIWIKENILEQLIVPRISDRVSNWDPTSDPVPIHSWLVPWLVILGDRIQAVMPPIRQKLQKALKLWDPKDRSAIGILRPWKNVWAKGTFTAFLAQNIVPKLSTTLEEMELDPRVNPEYDEWIAVMDWLELIHPDAIANIVAKSFFPRMYRILCQWLDSPGVNIQEVKMWYGEWKNRIPVQLTNFPMINESLRRCLIAIGQSMQGVRVGNLPPLQTHQPTMPQHIPRPMPTANSQLSLKDAIEMTAARNGFTYHPQVGRLKDGRQVFWFGAVSIYIDVGMVFVMDPVNFVWRPIGLDELIRLAKGSAG
ncbi:unnamed protein product [Caenorhabditis bovis]|uniref:Septin and tuftelin-interacting protein 1 homolog n=1 Tax=Caenorhabditis bovis TaxID=2654633 RepID=A0A8S1EW49_9PELO|nr:unnamed protein product [Caenorhabditis bovis]